MEKENRPDRDHPDRTIPAKPNSINLRSEEVQEIMGQIPPWILRWGITVLTVLLVGILTGSYFFKYPDKLTAEVTLTTVTPPVNLLAQASGRLASVTIQDKDHVRAGQILATIDNSADPADVEAFSRLFDRWKEKKISDSRFRELLETENRSLGELQGACMGLQKCLKDYLEYENRRYYPQKISMKEKQTMRQQELYRLREQEYELNLQQNRIAGAIFRRDSLLHAKGIGSQEEYERALQDYLQSRQAILSNQSSQKQIEIQKIQEEEARLDLIHQYTESRSQVEQALKTAAAAMETELNGWKKNYLIKSPIDGTVNQVGIWSPNQNVTAGSLVFTILPDHPEAPMGQALLPATGAGKVHPGQQVYVRVNNFPDQEFGFLVGKVKNISDIPDKDNLYLVQIAFPDGLKTNYGRTLPLSKQMVGNAEIIIKSKRLLERFVQPLENILNQP